jgi:hypothetical protein
MTTQYKDLNETLRRHLGNKVLEFKNGKVYGYQIDTYDRYEPLDLTLVNVIDNPVDKVLSVDTAYDLLFGAPTQPNFNKVLNI